MSSKLIFSIAVVYMAAILAGSFMLGAAILKLAATKFLAAGGVGVGVPLGLMAAPPLPPPPQAANSPVADAAMPKGSRGRWKTIAGLGDG